MALKQKLGRALAAIIPSVALVLLVIAPSAGATSSSWSPFVKRTTNAQDGPSWYDTAASYSGQYQVAVADGGDIFESSNYGASWTDVSSSLGTQSWVSVGMSSSGQYQTAGIYNGDIYTSSDYGHTWTNETSSGSAHNKEFYGIAVSSDGQYQAAAAYGTDLFVSSDYGHTWTNETVSTSAHGTNFDDVAMSANGQHMVAVTDADGLYISSDYGHTWTNVGTSGATLTSSFWTVTMSASGQVAYSANYNGDIYKSTNYGQTWTDITNGTPNLGNQEVYFISTSSDGKNVAFAGYNGDVYVSADGGAHWTNMTTSTSLSNAGFYPLALSGSGEYITSDVYNGGIYVSRNAALHPAETASFTSTVSGAAVTVSTPAGTNLTCHSSVSEAGQTFQDTYSYPMGLVKLCYSTVNAGDSISVTFETDLTPADVVARDYNTATHKWMTIPGAVVSATTLNGHHALMLTYTITDNGALDSDAAVGLVTDPVGLARIPGAPDTGFGTPNIEVPITLMVSGMLGVALVFRKFDRQN